MSKLSSVIDVDHVLNVVQVRCDDFGVSVNFDPYAKTAASDGKRIVLPTLKQPITQDSLDTLYGFVIHECGHHQRDDAFKILNSAQPPGHVCALYNIVEDDGMEREVANQWRGDKKALSTMNEILTDQVAISWENAFAQGLVDKEKQQPEPLAAMCVGRLAALDWDGNNDIVTSRLIKSMPDEANDLLSELIDEGWVDKFRKGKDPHDSWDTTIDLVKRLYPDHDEDQYEQMRQDGHEKSDPNKQDRDTSKDPSSANNGGQDEDGGASNPNGVPKGEPVQEAAGVGERQEDGRVISWKDVVMSEHNEWQPDEDTAPGGFGIDFRGKPSTGNVGLMPTSMVNVVDLSKRKNEREADTRGRGWKMREYTEFLPTEASSRAFANRIRRYIQSQARSVVQKERYHGRLDGTALVRLALPPIDGGEYNKRIFYDQRKHTMQDTAIFVLADWSGSMSGPKMHYAADASQRLVHTFDRVLNVPVALAAFSNRQTQCDVGYIKKFNARGTPAEEIAHRFADFYKWTSGNNDADAVNWAYHEIQKRQESRKLLIVLSDGCPAGSWGNTASDENLKHITSHIEREGKVELYGVGICSDAVEGYYSNCKVLWDPSEINETLFNVIKEGNNGRRK